MGGTEYLPLAALQSGIDKASEAVLEEEELTGSISNQLSVVSMALIAWAVFITLAIAVLVAVVFRRLRRSSRGANEMRWPSSASSAASVSSDAESATGHDSISELASVIDLDMDETEEIKHHEVDVENTNGLYEDDQCPGVHSNQGNSNTAATSDRPMFHNVLTRNDGHGSQKARGLFMPASPKY